MELPLKPVDSKHLRTYINNYRQTTKYQLKRRVLTQIYCVHNFFIFLLSVSFS